RKLFVRFALFFGDLQSGFVPHKAIGNVGTFVSALDRRFYQVEPGNRHVESRHEALGLARKLLS
ncbi:MAG: hypothetical protein WBD74_10210, partial [Candidatus Aquilonibacter sp.]